MVNNCWQSIHTTHEESSNNTNGQLNVHVTGNLNVNRSDADSSQKLGDNKSLSVTGAYASIGDSNNMSGNGSPNDSFKGNGNGKVNENVEIGVGDNMDEMDQQSAAARVQEDKKLYQNLPTRSDVDNTSNNNGSISMDKPEADEAKATSFVDRIRNVFYKTSILFTDPDLRQSHVLACVVWFTLSYGFYGLSEWMPSYLDTIGNVNTYVSTLVTNGASLPSCVCTAYIIEATGSKFFDWFDRRKVLALSMFGGAASLIGLLYVASGSQIVLLLAIFNAITVCGWTALDVVSTELSPTFVRSTAYGVFAAFGRIGAILGNITFGVFGTNDFAGPLTICGISLVVGTLACLGLPNMKGKSTH